MKWSRCEWLLLLVVALYYTWLVSHGTWQLFAREDYSDFFDQLIRSMMHGRLDVPADVLGREAFVIDGRYYGYWGPFPALLRLPLAFFGEDWIGHAARTSSLLAALLTVIAARGMMIELPLLLGRDVRGRWFIPAVWVSLAVGSIVPFLLSRAYIYHESILWGGATALITFWAGLRTLRTHGWTSLLVMLTAAGASALTRPTLGYGALLVAGLILMLELGRSRGASKPSWMLVRPGWKIAGLVALLGFFGSAPFGYNYMRFGTFVRMPYENYRFATPLRINVTRNGQILQRGNVWPNFVAYFRPGHIVLNGRFPYFYTAHYFPGPGQNLDNVEPHASVGSTMTGLVLLALPGLILFFRKPALLTLLAGALATTVLTCSATGLSERYVHDFFPLLTLGAAMGATTLAGLSGIGAGMARLVFVPMFMLSAAQSLAFALQFQRVEAPATAEKTTQEFEAFSYHVDDAIAPVFRWLTNRQRPEIEVTDWSKLPPGFGGQVIRRASPRAILRFDGQFWRLVEGACDEIVRVNVKVTLPPDDRPTAEPLLSVGVPGAATILILRSDGTGMWEPACDLYGKVFRRGVAFRPESRTFQLTLTIDHLNGLIQISQGQKRLLDYRHFPYPVAGYPIHIGENPFGGSYSNPTNRGRVVVVDPLP